MLYRRKMSGHLLPFAGRKYSGAVNQNLLWRDGNIYLMDNHRAALWCWQQEINLYEQPHSILHIDRHTDCLSANLDKHIAAMPDLRGLSINDYLAAHVSLHGDDVPLFRWDNYLSIYLAAFHQNVESLRSADHGDGDAPQYPMAMRPRADELPENMLYWLASAASPWIVNIDLDYFFCQGEPCDDDDGKWFPLFSDEFVDTVCRQLKAGLDAGHVKVVTVCLTPSNFTPGWQECLDMSEKIFSILGAKLPRV